VIAWVSELFLWEPEAPRNAAPPSTRLVVEVTVGSAVTAAAVLPAFLGFAEPAKRYAAARVVARQLFGVILCGALLALGNFIFTLCSKQWVEAGLPADLPLLVARPGGGAIPASHQTPAGGAVHVGNGTPQNNDWQRQYMD
jgi:hypothetical protein